MFVFWDFIFSFCLLIELDGDFDSVVMFLIVNDFIFLFEEVN